jgi:cytosine deaminase
VGGRVTVSHAYELGDIPADALKKTTDILARSGVAVMIARTAAA